MTLWMENGRGLSASSWHRGVGKEILSVVCLLWLTGSKSPIHLMFSWLYMEAFLGLISDKPRCKMQNIFQIPPAIYAWRTTVYTEIEPGLYNRLKIIPKMWCSCAQMSVAHATGNISHCRVMRGEGRAQEAEYAHRAISNDSYEPVPKI